MRCLALADTLRRRGAEVRFFVNEGAEVWVPALGMAHWQTVSSSTEAAADTIARSGGADILIIDHYGIEEADERLLAGVARKVVVIDDLADRRHDCALLINQNFGRHPSDYDGLVADGAELLVGARYAILRQEFGAARAAVLARKDKTAGPRRLIVSMGLTDVRGVTLAIVEALAGFDLEIDVLIAPSAPSYDQLIDRAANDPRITLHLPGADMVELMSAAHAAIGAAGSTAWERCCLGLPTVMLVLAENQRAPAAALAAAGAAILMPGPADAAHAAAALVRDPARLGAMSCVAFGLVDGLGAERIADRVMAL